VSPRRIANPIVCSSRLAHRSPHALLRRPFDARHEVTMEAEPRLAFVHVDDVPWTEVIAQLHGERRVSVHEKFINVTHGGEMR